LRFVFLRAEKKKDLPRINADERGPEQGLPLMDTETLIKERAGRSSSTPNWDDLCPPMRKLRVAGGGWYAGGAGLGMDPLKSTPIWDLWDELGMNGEGARDPKRERLGMLTKTDRKNILTLQKDWRGLPRRTAKEPESDETVPFKVPIVPIKVKESR
jgi:hypothetical protein